MVAVLIVGFLVGFISVLCIGNYFRAKRAMERQKQRRLARLSSNGGQGIVDSPRSHQSSASGASGRSEEQQYLLGRAPDPTRRRNNVDETGDLLRMNENRHTANLMSV
jgi:hypothetical protein